MIKREQFEKKLHEIGYKYTDENKRTRKFRRGTHPIYVKKGSLVRIEYVRSALRQAGVSEQEIEDFLLSASS